MKEKEGFDKVKSRILLRLEEIIKGVDNWLQIRKIDDDMFSRYRPNNFVGSESVEVKYDRQFEDSCLLISQKTNADAKRMTVLQFYNAIDNIKRQAEAEAKAYSKYKH